MIKLTENQKAFFRSMKESPELEQHGFHLLLRRKNFADFFDVLKTEGFFVAEKNPAPQESEGLVTVAYWPALDYLLKCADQSSRSATVDLAEKVMATVREVSHAHHGTLRDNSHTADVFAQILGLLPPSVVLLADVGFVSRWIRVRFTDGRVAHALDKGALLTFLNSDNSEDWPKALEILRHCTDFRWATGEREPESIVEVYSLSKLVEHHAAAFGRKLGVDAVRLFEDRLREIFSRGDRDRLSDMIRPAIEEHEQNRSTMEFANCLVFGIRDALLAWCAVDADGARGSVKNLLENDFQILRRVGIYILNERWSDLTDLYTVSVKPKFFDPAHIHELYALLKRRFGSLPDAVKAQTLEAIRTLPEPDVDDPVTSRRSMQLRWLDALKDTSYEPAVRFHRTLQDEADASEAERPDFRFYAKARWGPGPSPYDVAELVAFSEAGIIAAKLNEFEPLERWGSPSQEGLVAALEAAVVASPETFIRALPRLVLAKAQYLCGILHALRHFWDQSEQSQGPVSWRRAWPQIIGFLEELTSEPEFWEQINQHHRQGWVASAIADLLERGTRDDARAYPEEFLPRGFRLVRKLLGGVKPTAADDEADPMTAAINTPKGHAVEALFSYALRRCRMSDRQSKSRDAAWSEVQPLFDEELARCTRTNYEFSTLAGAYLSNLDYMNARWVEDNLAAIFSDDDPAAFIAAVGGLAYSGPTRHVYQLLREANIIDRALDAKLRGRDVREKLVERILLAFMWNEESIDSPRMTFSFIHGIVGDLRAAASFLWMIRDDQLTEEQRDRVIEYWAACNDWAATREGPLEELFDALGHLAWALRDVEGHKLELLLAVVPHMVHRHNIYELLKELNRLVTVSPSGVGTVLRSIVDTNRPVYDYKDRLKTLIRGLSSAGEPQVAIYCANKLITLPGMDKIYERLVEQD